MNIYLIRHSEAEPVSSQVRDFDRNLTVQGEESLRKAADGWKKLISQFDFIVSSPLNRALQTAEIIKEGFKTKSEIIIDKKVVGGTTKEILEIAFALDGKEIAFCGHEPTMSNYLSEMTCSGNLYLSFRKAMIAKIHFDGRPRLGAGELEFLIPAKAYK